MFSCCYELRSVDTSNITVIDDDVNCREMFSQSNNLTAIDLSNFHLSYPNYNNENMLANVHSISSFTIGEYMDVNLSNLLNWSDSTQYAKAGTSETYTVSDICASVSGPGTYTRLYGFSVYPANNNTADVITNFDTGKYSYDGVSRKTYVRVNSMKNLEVKSVVNGVTTGAPDEVSYELLTKAYTDVEFYK